jgi:GNAT superfamily N-acetyltransferase
MGLEQVAVGSSQWKGSVRGEPVLLLPWRYRDTVSIYGDLCLLPTVKTMPDQYRFALGSLQEPSRRSSLYPHPGECTSVGVIGFADITINQHVQFFPKELQSLLEGRSWVSIIRLGIEKKYQRQGYGEGLALLIEQYAHETGHQLIIGERFKQSDPRSKQLYTKLGYTFAVSDYPHRDESPLYGWKDLATFSASQARRARRTYALRKMLAPLPGYQQARHLVSCTAQRLRRYRRNLQES